jgi:hypothetical protein
MDYTSGADNVGGQFTDGDPGAGQAATAVDSVWLNGVQNELVKLIEDSGETPDAALDTQIRRVLLKWQATQNLLFNANMQVNYNATNVTAVAAGESKRIADKVLVEATGLDITGILIAPTGFTIVGSGNIGDSFTLQHEITRNFEQATPFNLGISPVPVDVFTAAIRAATLSGDASVGLDMAIEHSPALEDILTMAELDTTAAVLAGGGVDSYGLATARYTATGQLDKAGQQRAAGPLVTFTLKSSGVFRVHISGVALYKAHVSDAFVPSVLLGDYLADEAWAKQEYENRYRQIRTIADMYSVCKVDVAGTLTQLDLWVPFSPELGFTPTVPEMDVRDVSGTTHGTTSEAWTSIISADALSATAAGAHVRIFANHASGPGAGVQRAQASFVLEAWNGHAF